MSSFILKSITILSKENKSKDLSNVYCIILIGHFYIHDSVFMIRPPKFNELE